MDAWNRIQKLEGDVALLRKEFVEYKKHWHPAPAPPKLASLVTGTAAGEEGEDSGYRARVLGDFPPSEDEAPPWNRRGDCPRCKAKDSLRYPRMGSPGLICVKCGGQVSSPLP